MARLSDHPENRIPWNAARLVGAKPPLKPKHIWAIRQRLADAGRVRDLALFNCAIDSKLRGCDLLSLRSRAQSSAIRPTAPTATGPGWSV